MNLNKIFGPDQNFRQFDGYKLIVKPNLKQFKIELKTGV